MGDIKVKVKVRLADAVSFEGTTRHITDQATTQSAQSKGCASLAFESRSVLEQLSDEWKLIKRRKSPMTY